MSNISSAAQTCMISDKISSTESKVLPKVPNPDSSKNISKVVSNTDNTPKFLFADTKIIEPVKPKHKLPETINKPSSLKNSSSVETFDSIENVSRDESLVPETENQSKRQKIEYKAIDSLTIANRDAQSYRHCLNPDEDPPLASEGFRFLELEYPFCEIREKFALAIPNHAHDDYAPLNDIISTVQFIAFECLKDNVNDLGDLQMGIVRQIIKHVHRKSPQDLIKAVNDYNATISALKKAKKVAFHKPISYEFTTHILEQAYARSVAPLAQSLKKYEGFSNNVYGEIKPIFVHDILQNVSLLPNHIFLDMGSGTGNVVFQVAAECQCDCYGIEIMANPASLARKQKKEFLKRMEMYGKKCGEVFLKQGDFLIDDAIQKVISKANVIFVNNYAFHADLNQSILVKFLDCLPSVQIVSLKSFVSSRHGGSSRNINSIDRILKVKEYPFPKNSCSWMADSGSYYVHTIKKSL